MTGTREARLSAARVTHWPRPSLPSSGNASGASRATAAVTFKIPISDRTEEDDTRAMALSYARVTVDPTQSATDLREIRAAVKQTLRTLKETPDEVQATPVAAVVHAEANAETDGGQAPADPDQPVFASYLGDLSSLISQADGTVAALRQRPNHWAARIAAASRANGGPHCHPLWTHQRQDLHQHRCLSARRREHHVRSA